MDDCLKWASHKSTSVCAVLLSWLLRHLGVGWLSWADHCQFYLLFGLLFLRRGIRKGISWLFLLTAPCGFWLFAKLRVTNVEPPFGSIPNQDSLFLPPIKWDEIEFPLAVINDHVLHRNQRCIVRLFYAECAGKIIIRCQSPKHGLLNYYPCSIDGKLAEHILTMETSATGVETNSQKFKFIFSTANRQGPLFKIEEVLWFIF